MPSFSTALPSAPTIIWPSNSASIDGGRPAPAAATDSENWIFTPAIPVPEMTSREGGVVVVDGPGDRVRHPEHRDDLGHLRALRELGRARSPFHLVWMVSHFSKLLGFENSAQTLSGGGGQFDGRVDLAHGAPYSSLVGGDDGGATESDVVLQRGLHVRRPAACRRRRAAARSARRTGRARSRRAGGPWRSARRTGSRPTGRRTWCRRRRRAEPPSPSSQSPSAS